MKKSFLKNSHLLLTCLFVFFIFVLESPSISVDSPLINSTLTTYQSQDTVRNTNVVWVYKTVNGKTYKRRYNTATKQWLETGFHSDANGLPHYISAGRPFLIVIPYLFIYTYSYNPHVPRSVRRTLP